VQSTDPLQAAFRRDRAIILSSLLLITLIAWGYTVYLAQGMSAMGEKMAMPMMRSWDALDFWLMFVMWVVMMIGMMVPSASPMILTYTAACRRRHPELDTFLPTGAFLLGYLVMWAGFSLVATLAQWGLHTTALLSPMMVGTSPQLGGAILVATGVFQWTPFKHACLRHCRSPIGFLLNEWRDGPRGALVMGLRHGLYCTACCWFLMLLLFVAGVMNLLWVAVLTVFVLLEKVAPRGEWIARAAGGILVVWGMWMITF
jgi:predicted metal-binding membrane protein